MPTCPADGATGIHQIQEASRARLQLTARQRGRRRPTAPRLPAAWKIGQTFPDTDQRMDVRQLVGRIDGDR